MVSAFSSSDSISSICSHMLGCFSICFSFCCWLLFLSRLLFQFCDGGTFLRGLLFVSFVHYCWFGFFCGKYAISVIESLVSVCPSLLVDISLVVGNLSAVAICLLIASFEQHGSLCLSLCGQYCVLRRHLVGCCLRVEMRRCDWTVP